jgi:hypothetical protein
MESFLGSGDLYMDRLTDAGVQQGAKTTGSATKFALNPESEIKEQIGKGRTTHGQVSASATMPGKTNINITLNQLDAENLAVAFLGDVSAFTQASGSISGEAITAHADRYTELAKEAVSNVVVKDDADTTTYVEGTDYILHERLGMVKPLSTGDIADGATLHVNYDHAEVTAEKITGGTSPIIRARLLLDGKNFVDGRNCKVLVYDARLRPNTEVDFLSDDFLPLDLTGVCEIPEGKDEPFEIVYYQ